MNPTNDNFQKIVDSMLIQHQSILDILSKGQEASARVNRAIIKSVTSCGCISIEAQKYTIPEEATLADLKFIFNSHLKGVLCPNCRDIIETELGKQFFYIAALANTLGFSLDEVLEKEQQKLKTLTVYNLR
ncbi:MAG: hypothetical protein AWM53_02038 [Candidatus Dichloromethanomonas elyunquensis]|nr:MAG: hypothetical protein AWM53_02038 [Candidatus Dichloromethanomonas elyunquensis]